MTTFDQDKSFIIGVGCQKAGTTTLAKFLKDNGVSFPKKKELHAFQNHRFTSRREYLSRLGLKRHDSGVFGEFTPNTIYNPTSLWNLSKILPEAKLIVSLRDPVERAFSAYHHAVGIGSVGDDESFHEIVLQSLRGTHRHWVKNILPMGLYGPQVRRLLELFPLEQVHFIDFDRMRSKDSQTTAEDLAKFCSIDLSQPDFIKVNQRSHYASRQLALTQEIDDSTRRLLKDFFAQSNSEVQKLVALDLDWIQN